jgi:uncharacterized LabA/DUF88 family protein
MIRLGEETMMDELDLIVVDGPNLYNSVARFITRENNRTPPRDYIKTCFDVDRLTAATITPSKAAFPFTPRLGIVIFHSSQQLGSDKTVRLTDNDVRAFWARQGANHFCSTELVELPGRQMELTEAVCPNCEDKVICQNCSQPARMAERREKGVDTSITTYLLETTDRWESACIISGDVDFVPPVRSLKRRGKRVFCAVEPGSEHRDLTQVCTSHFELNLDFLKKDLKRFEILKPGGRLDIELENLRTAGGTVQELIYFMGDNDFTAMINFVPPPGRSPHDIAQEINRLFTPMYVSADMIPRGSAFERLGVEEENSRLHGFRMNRPDEMDSALRIEAFSRDASDAETGILRHFEEITRDAQWRKLATINERL